MATNHIYVDSSVGTDTGAGTVGDPYGNLAYAFSQLGTISNDTQVNVKGTSSGSPETLLGTLPGGTNVSRQLHIKAYEVTANDTDNYCYLDAGGVDTPWLSGSIDAVSFNRCYFQNTAGGFFFDLDNQCSMYDCVLDGCGAAADSTCQWWRCSFINQTEQVASCQGTIAHCYIEGSGSISSTIVAGSFVVGNVIRWDGSCNRLVQMPSAGGICMNNYVEIATGGTRSDICIRTDDMALISGNVIVGGKVGIDKESNSVYLSVGYNVFYDVGQLLWSSTSNDIVMTDPDTVTQTTLTGHPFPNAASKDYTPSTEFQSLSVGANAMRIPEITDPDYKVHFGPMYDPPAGGGGGSSFTPRLRVIQ